MSNKKRKGFTLIELLAVIVVIAIIALIAVPNVLGIIIKARKGSAESSTYTYIKGIQREIFLSSLSNKVYENRSDYSYDDIEVEVSGTRPSSGTFEVVENLSGRDITCESSNANVATCSVSRNTIIVNPGTTEGTATLTIKSSATKKYREAKAVYVASTAKGTLSNITASGSNQYYVTLNSNITLYAIWLPVIDFTYTYDRLGSCNCSGPNPLIPTISRTYSSGFAYMPADVKVYFTYKFVENGQCGNGVVQLSRPYP